MQKPKTPFHSYLCNTFRNHRLQVGATQMEMARSLHITPRSYSGLERGEFGCSAATLVFLLNDLPDEEALHLIHELARKLLEEETT